MIAVAVRSCGERTEEACIMAANLVSDNVVVIREAPFFRAVLKTFEFGASTDADVLLALDADVVLHSGGRDLIGDLKMDDDILRIDLRVADKFRGTVYAGCHAYNNDYSEAILRIMEDSSFQYDVRRPESSSASRGAKLLGAYCKNGKNEPVGDHDYDQWFKHIYAKYYNRAIRDYKSYDKIYDMIARKASANPDDMDFTVALEGMQAGKGVPPDSIVLDCRIYPDASNIMSKLDLPEKESML